MDFCYYITTLLYNHVQNQEQHRQKVGYPERSLRFWRANMRYYLNFLTTQFNQTFFTQWNCFGYATQDELLIFFDGIHPAKKFMPIKPRHYGLKVFTLATRSTTNKRPYLVNFLLTLERLP